MPPVRVALTFDAEHPDRPNRPETPVRLLDLLGERGVRATFFVQGRWAQAFPALVRRMASDGHLIGSHSHYHARMALLSADGFETDVRAAEWAVERAGGVSPRPWFRCPFGNAADHPRTLRLLDKLGYRHVGWNVAAREWRVRARADEVAQTLHDGILEHGDGAIVLAHTWPDSVPGAFETLIDELAGRVAFVRLDELGLGDGLDPVATPPTPG
ncbi:MAG: polysaccharide deacetylase family protein [Chloroflexota bacterium]|nr:polysaccharide deacetylase family protein [Chloroflexota bacterium]